MAVDPAKAVFLLSVGYAQTFNFVSPRQKHFIFRHESKSLCISIQNSVDDGLFMACYLLLDRCVQAENGNIF
jgi:hypothetical protein